ncbi:MAG: hypothetical protein N3D76_12315 [Geminocystis sp.]|nr:hypothetical protein [Geminocystis sp.]
MAGRGGIGIGKVVCRKSGEVAGMSVFLLSSPPCLPFTDRSHFPCQGGFASLLFRILRTMHDADGILAEATTTEG